MDKISAEELKKLADAAELREDTLEKVTGGMDCYAKCNRIYSGESLLSCYDGCDR